MNTYPKSISYFQGEIGEHYLSTWKLMFFISSFITLTLWINKLSYKIYPNSKKSMTHYDDVIMGAMASQITSLTIFYSTVYSFADQRKHKSSASLAFVWGIHRWPVNSPHKWPVTRKFFPFDDVTMKYKEEFPSYWSTVHVSSADSTNWLRNNSVSINS